MPTAGKDVVGGNEVCTMMRTQAPNTESMKYLRTGNGVQEEMTDDGRIGHCRIHLLHSTL